MAVDAPHGVLEPVVDHDVRELVLRGELLLGGAQALLDLHGVVGAAADQPRAQRLARRRRDEDLDRVGQRARTCRAPSSSISSTTGVPAAVRRSSSERSVP